MDHYQRQYGSLPVYHEGNSRVLKQTEEPTLLLSKLKATVFSIEHNGPVVVAGIDLLRTRLNSQFCDLLHSHGIRTNTLDTKNDLILVRKHVVPPIEVVVKGAMVGTPLHLYHGMSTQKTRHNTFLKGKERHVPYVRFDWRNPLPYQDACLPDVLADQFIDTTTARHTALAAFHILEECLMRCDLLLLDICFFMNEAGDTLCGEVSTDNTRISYVGSNPTLLHTFASTDKHATLQKASAINQLLETVSEL